MHRGAEGSIAQPSGVIESPESAAPAETIAAISTPAGEGAIALVRLSGDDAIAGAVVARFTARRFCGGWVAFDMAMSRKR